MLAIPGHAHMSHVRDLDQTKDTLADNRLNRYADKHELPPGYVVEPTTSRVRLGGNATVPSDVVVGSMGVYHAPSNTWGLAYCCINRHVAHVAC